jgi:hypothetical protein
MALEVKDRPLTRAEFCEFAQISYGLHKLVRNGDGPRVTRIARSSGSCRSTPPNGLRAGFNREPLSRTAARN